MLNNLTLDKAVALAADRDLVLLDLDGTLLSGDSDHAWGEFLCEIAVVDMVAYRAKNNRFLQDYQHGKLRIDDYLQFVLSLLKNCSMRNLHMWRRQYLDQKIRPMVRPFVQPFIAGMRRKGCFLAIVTSTNDFLAEPIGYMLGIEDVISTVFEVVDGCFSGRTVGIPCYQQGKICKTEDWVKSSGTNYGRSWYYGDSLNDLPMMEWADFAVAVQPDRHLSQVAAANNWFLLEYAGM